MSGRGSPVSPRSAGATLPWLTGTPITRDSMPTVRFVPGSVDIHGDLQSLPPLVRGVHDAWALAFGVIGMTLTALLVKHSSPGEIAKASARTGGMVAKAGVRGTAGIGPRRDGRTGRLAVGPGDRGRSGVPHDMVRAGRGRPRRGVRDGPTSPGVVRGRRLRSRLPDPGLRAAIHGRPADEPLAQCRPASRRPDHVRRYPRR